MQADSRTCIEDVDVHEAHIEPSGAWTAAADADMPGIVSSSSGRPTEGGPSYAAQIRAGSSFVKLFGHLGPEYGTFNVTLISADSTRTTYVHARDACAMADGLLWMAPLDPALRYSISVVGWGPAKVGLTSLVTYAAAW
jgi:hypothetical protein